MRKGMLLSLIMVLVFSVVPNVMAQDEELPTIADVVVSSTESDPAEFTILLAAVQAADPEFLEILSNPVEYNGYTVFAPTDAAFTATIEALGLTAEDVLANQALLNVVLSYHVVPGYFTSDTLTASEGEYYVGTALPDNALKITNTGEGVMVNEANVVEADVEASNGVVHVIDAVLVPEGLLDMVAAVAATADTEMEEVGTIADVASATDEFSTLVSAIGQVAESNPEVVDLVSNPNTAVTVFAPTNDAFGTLPEGALETVQADNAMLSYVLGYHVVPGIFTSQGLVALGAVNEGGTFNLLTATGVPVTVVVSDAGVQIGGVNVIATDVLVDNGVIHTVEGVILPPVEE